MTPPKMDTLATMASDIRSVRERLDTHIVADEKHQADVMEDQRLARESRAKIHSRIDGVNAGQNRILVAVAGAVILILVGIVLQRVGLKA